MNVQEFLFNGNSKTGQRIFKTMLNWLDHPARLKYDDPEKLVRASGIQAGQRVLEIGCGSGFFTPAISKQVGAAGSVAAVDLHPAAVEAARKKVDDLALRNVTVQCGDATRLEFSEGQFDLALLYGVVPAPVLSFLDVSREARRVLKPNGIFAVWTKAPVWSPKEATQSGWFTLLGKQGGVFLLRRTV